jgi:hypothetical protein
MLAVSCLCHLLLGAGLFWLVGGGSIKEQPERTAHVRFVKAAPPRQRPLSRRVLAAPAHRPLVRQQRVQATPATAARPGAGTVGAGSAPGAGGPGSGEGTGQGWGAGAGEGGGGFLTGLAGPAGQGGLPLGSGLGLGGGGIGPGLRAGAVGGQRTGSDEIDLSMELLGVEALDTGRHRAMVVVDPKNKRKLKGFLYLASVYSEAIERAELDSQIPRRFSNVRPHGIALRQVVERETLQGLADKMTKQTQVKTQVLDWLDLKDPKLLQVPFVLLTVNAPFACTEAEARNLGRYLTGGGFLYAENVYWPRSVGNDFTSDQPALRALVRAAFQQVGYQEGKDWRFVQLDPSHPLYHCYYDISSLPLGFWDWTYAGQTAPHFSPAYLEGIQVGERLAGVYSQKNYADFWAGEAEYIRTHTIITDDWFTMGGEELPVYRLGVNILVYALTQEGSLARRLVSVE